MHLPIVGDRQEVLGVPPHRVLDPVRDAAVEATDGFTTAGVEKPELPRRVVDQREAVVRAQVRVAMEVGRAVLGHPDEAHALLARDAALRPWLELEVEDVDVRVRPHLE